MKCPSCGYVNLGTPAACRKCGAVFKSADAGEHLLLLDEDQPPAPLDDGGENGVREGGWRVIREAAPPPAETPPPVREQPSAAPSAETKTARKATARRVAPRAKAEAAPAPTPGPAGEPVGEKVPDRGSPSPAGDILEELFNFEPVPATHGTAPSSAPEVPPAPGPPRQTVPDAIFEDFRIDLEEPLRRVPARAAEKALPSPAVTRTREDPMDGVLPLRDPDRIPPSFAGEEPAPLAPRTAAFIVDHLMVAMLVLLFTAGAGAGLVLAGVAPRWLITHFWPGDALLPFFLLALLLSGTYFVSWQWLRGSTPGMRRYRLKVVGSEGRSLSLADALFRWLGCLVSTAPLGLGFIWSLWDRGRLTWHDRLTGTLVVSEGESGNKSA